ncbi:CoA-binding protein [Sungkyunkwania multivorans]|uniref:CoA-binding protein n=1 Tax=Sungkyunkwania multivorans TaxID=1173618 RepID=A0ABW3CTW1_9FLAO
MKKKTLVLGASTKPHRYSNIAINRLAENQHDIVAFGLREGVVNGIEIDTELMDYNGIDTVTLYMKPERQVAYYDYIIGLKPKRVIFNPGTENREFYQLLQKEGVEVAVACTLTLLATNQY